MTYSVLIGLSAVMVAVHDDMPLVLVTQRDTGEDALPFGPFDPEQHRTFDLSLRVWVREQTGFELGYVEQLYAPTGDQFEARWQGWYRYFPWEDHRNGRPAIIDAELAPHLYTWASGNQQRLDRARIAFGLDGARWVEERVLERYELLYEAGLVAECARDADLPPPATHLGATMASDHRRILATALARLRGKVKYRPVVFELLQERFTLSALQRTVEGILGLSLHTQNFRRALEKTDLVKGTGRLETSTGGRPAELYEFRRDYVRGIAAPGLATPRKTPE